MRGDLVRILTKLLKKKKKSAYDGIIIETTGLADPAPVAQTFFVDVRRLVMQPCSAHMHRSQYKRAITLLLPGSTCMCIACLCSQTVIKAPFGSLQMPALGPPHLSATS